MVVSHFLSLTDDLYNIMRIPLAYDTPAEPVESNMRWSRQSSLVMSCFMRFVIQIFARIRRGYLEDLFVLGLAGNSHTVPVVRVL